MLIHGNCLKVLPTLPDNSVDSIVTDPPYEISFMAKKWDGSGIAYDVRLWAEVLRVLKPGGHLLAFGGTRTYHRMAVAIEDAGFEIRDSLHWVYGSGFPKSLDVSKAIDKAAGAVGERGPMKRGGERLARLKDGKRDGEGRWGDEVGRNPYTTIPATDAARQWEGWGTALKPAHEPIVVARKPLVGTVAANVLEHGTGALNIDGCRVAAADAAEGRVRHGGGVPGNGSSYELPDGGAPMPAGRWPANLVLTHAAECGEACAEGCPVTELDGQSNGASRFFTVTEWDPIADVAPFRYVAKPSKRERNAGLDGLPERNKTDDPYGYANARRGRCDACARWADSGEGDNCRLCGAAFDRTANEQKPMSNHHPTVKPVALMRWLVRLVTSPGGTVLDPFAGSGTTLVAAVLEGYDAIGIEMTDDYLPIIEGRIEWAKKQPQKLIED